MPAIVYLHGFLSSPLSFKAEATKAWLAQTHPDCDFFCPELSAYPQQAQLMLDELLANIQQPLRIIGSSLGGFWATYLVERSPNARAVLINPAVSPHKLVGSLVGKPLKNYYTEHFYTLTPACEQALQALGTGKPRHLEQYWLMVQTGDETLDYRAAVDHYQGCKQTVLDGGNHAFEGYEQYLPAIYQFLTEQ